MLLFSLFSNYIFRILVLHIAKVHFLKRIHCFEKIMVILGWCLCWDRFSFWMMLILSLHQLKNFKFVFWSQITHLHVLLCTENWGNIGQKVILSDLSWNELTTINFIDTNFNGFFPYITMIIQISLRERTSNLGSNLLFLFFTWFFLMLVSQFIDNRNLNKLRVAWILLVGTGAMSGGLGVNIYLKLSDHLFWISEVLIIILNKNRLSYLDQWAKRCFDCNKYVLMTFVFK